MSFILDALKRAEADRSRGAIPTLHAQPIHSDALDAGGLSVKQLVCWIAAALVLLAGAWVWWGWGDADPAPHAATPRAPSGAPAAAQRSPSLASTQTPAPSTAPTPLPQAEPSPASMLPAATESQPRRLPPVVVSAPVVLPPVARYSAAPALDPAPAPAPAPALAPVPIPAPVPRPSAVVKRALPGARAESNRPTGTAEVAAARADDRIYALNELPDELRNSLPVLTVGGATYSENAASRMLILNGRLFHEGDPLTPELTLQQIKLRSAVLIFRGTRYRISY